MKINRTSPDHKSVVLSPRPRLAAFGCSRAIYENPSGSREPNRPGGVGMPTEALRVCRTSLQSTVKSRMSPNSTVSVPLKSETQRIRLGSLVGRALPFEPRQDLWLSSAALLSAAILPKPFLPCHRTGPVHQGRRYGASTDPPEARD